MSYSLIVDPALDKVLNKLFKKNRKQYEMIMKKAEEIIENPHHYKNLRAPMQRYKRVHIDDHFVLIFSVEEETKTVTLEEFDHHDEIYEKK